MSFNDNAILEIMNEIYDDYSYLVYGTGSVADNATSLVTEIDRAALVEATRYSGFFECIYAIGVGDGNDEILLEFGMAKADVGNIATTFVYYPIEKNSSYEILITTRTIIRNI